MTNNEEFEKILENIDENGPEPQEEPERQYYFIKKARALVKKMSEELGRPLISSVTTFGCQMNARDSEKLIGILEKIGYVMTEDEHADFVIYNTCTVRENANQRVYGRLGALNSMKKKNPFGKPKGFLVCNLTQKLRGLRPDSGSHSCRSATST